MRAVLIYSFLIGLNLGCMFLSMPVYNWWNPMAAGFITGLLFVHMTKRVY